MPADIYLWIAQLLFISDTKVLYPCLSLLQYLMYLHDYYVSKVWLFINIKPFLSICKYLNYFLLNNVLSNNW